jgi:hypothetical protein
VENKFIVDGSRVFTAELPEGLVQDELPLAVYFLKTAQGAMYLEKDTDEIELPERIYGTVTDKTSDVLTTYKAMDSSLGVMLTGYKGSGKSLQMNHIAQTALKDLKLPIIRITEPVHGASFQKFMDTIGEAVILIDEFGKLYPPDKEYDDTDTVDQNSLLSFFDGASAQKRIIILTENKTHLINDFIKERPGRVLFHWEYERLEEETLVEYCEYHLENKEKFLQPIKDFYTSAISFTIDTAKAIVSQCNIFDNKEFSDITARLNISKPETKKYRIVSIQQEHDLPLKFERLVVNSMYQVGNVRVSCNDFSKLPNAQQWKDAEVEKITGYYVDLKFKSYSLGTTTFTGTLSYGDMDPIEFAIEVERDFSALAA